ncbi:MAG: hypothetical protein AMXMBFR61_24140 [Fimbriimonadales bacterium]
MTVLAIATVAGSSTLASSRCSRALALVENDNPRCSRERIYEFSETRKCCDWRIAPNER